MYIVIMTRVYYSTNVLVCQGKNSYFKNRLPALTIEKIDRVLMGAIYNKYLGRFTYLLRIYIQDKLCGRRKYVGDRGVLLGRAIAC
jgi:hypothetical protein